jgi:hypothetical protein
MTSIPERIAQEARAVYASSPIKVIGDLEAGSLINHFAKALLAAEQRGREMEREECAQFVTSCSARFGVQSQNPTRSESVADICHIFDGYLRGVAALIRLRSKQGKGE